MLPKKKTKWGLISVVTFLFLMSVVSSCEEANERNFEPVENDAELETVMGLLKMFDQVREDDSEGYSIQLEFDDEGNPKATIKKVSKNISGRVSGTHGDPLCESEDLDIGFARCARKQAKTLGCIIIRTCAWCAYPCDEQEVPCGEQEEVKD